jgi:pentatricopeptide repeat protein
MVYCSSSGRAVVSLARWSRSFRPPKIDHHRSFPPRSFSAGTSSLCSEETSLGDARDLQLRRGTIGEPEKSDGDGVSQNNGGAIRGSSKQQEPSSSRSTTPRPRLYINDATVRGVIEAKRRALDSLEADAHKLRPRDFLYLVNNIAWRLHPWDDDAMYDRLSAVLLDYLDRHPGPIASKRLKFFHEPIVKLLSKHPGHAMPFLNHPKLNYNDNGDGDGDGHGHGRLMRAPFLDRVVEQLVSHEMQQLALDLFNAQPESERTVRQLTALVRSQDQSIGERAWGILLDSDQLRSQMTLDSFHARLEHLAFLSKTGGQGEVRAEMEKLGIKPVLETYNRLVWVFVCGRDVREAYRVVERMMDDGISPDTVTYNMLVRATLRYDYNPGAPRVRRSLLRIAELSGLEDVRNVASQRGLPFRLWENPVWKAMEPDDVTSMVLAKNMMQWVDVRAEHIWEMVRVAQRGSRLGIYRVMLTNAVRAFAKRDDMVNMEKASAMLRGLGTWRRGQEKRRPRERLKWD